MHSQTAPRLQISKAAGAQVCQVLSCLSFHYSYRWGPRSPHHSWTPFRYIVWKRPGASKEARVFTKISRWQLDHGDNTKLPKPSLGKGQSDLHCWWQERQGPLQRMEGDGKSPSLKRKGKWSDRFLLDLEQMPAKGRGGAVSALTQERIVQASLQHLCYEYQRGDWRKEATINRVCMCIRETKQTRKSEKLVWGQKSCSGTLLWGGVESGSQSRN